MTLDEAILQAIRVTSRGLWQRVRARLLLRVILLAPAAGLWTLGVSWLLGDGKKSSLYRDMFAGGGIALLAFAIVAGGLALALLDALGAVVVEGPCLRSLGDVLVRPDLRLGGPRLADQMAAFATSRQLSRLARVGDLPLIMFLARSVLSQDVRPLLTLAATGVGRDDLIRRLEDQVRGHAAGAIRKARVVVLLVLAGALSLPRLVTWLLR